MREEERVARGDQDTADLDAVIMWAFENTRVDAKQPPKRSRRHHHLQSHPTHAQHAWRPVASTVIVPLSLRTARRVSGEATSPGEGPRKMSKHDSSS